MSRPCLLNKNWACPFRCLKGTCLRLAGVKRGGSTDSAEFILPLGDLGSGAVDLTLQRGSGSATFTRATTAWTKLSSGLWASVGSGVARSSYIGFNTAVSAYGGYLSEGAGTQLVTPTAAIRDMTDAAWVKTNVTAAKTATGIDGVASSATRLTAGAIGGSILQTLVAAASTRTYSVWLRRVSGTGTVTISQGATTLNVMASLSSSTYTRVELSASVLNSAFGITLGTSGDVIDADFNQFEAGAFATTPMPAAGAARNADVLTYPTTGWLNPEAGTLFGQMVFNSSVTDNRALTINDGGGNERFLLRASGSNANFFVVDGAATQVALSDGAVSVGTVTKLAAAWATNDFAVTGNGGTVVTDTLGTLPTVTTLHVGYDPSGVAETSFFGSIRHVTYWSRRLSNATLQSLTS